MTQDQALDILKTGRSVFLTGEPGSGKTYIVNRYASWLRSCGIPFAITASTGIAATHIGGRTVHSFAGIGVKEALTKQDLARIAKNDRVARRVRSSRVLIIDEVSMLAGRTLAMVEQVCRKLKDADMPFGGLQVVLVGDFFQLPPIARREENVVRQGTLLDDGQNALFCFASSAWERLNPTVCYLAEQHRQEDPIFLRILSQLRQGSVSHETRQLLHDRYAPFARHGVTQLFSHNADVDRINEIELLKLHGKERVCKMTSGGLAELVEQLKRGCLSPERLALKVGARVMFTKNDPLNRFVNGSLGVVERFDDTSFDDDDGYADGGYPLVRLLNGRVVRAEQTEWSIDDGWGSLARISQIPLRLAWALTVHKSQGMSLDAAHMDLSHVFEYGQGYVALSRVRTLAGLSLIGFNDRALQVHPDIVRKDADFRELSNREREYIRDMSREECLRAQTLFVQACGGRHVAQRGEGNVEPQKSEIRRHRLGSIREQFGNAYRPWTEAEERILSDMFKTGEKIPNIAQKLGRQNGAIHSRLKKIGLAVEMA